MYSHSGCVILFTCMCTCSTHTFLCQKKEAKSLKIGCGGRTRTFDLWVMSPTSCQLLHPAISLTLILYIYFVLFVNIFFNFCWFLLYFYFLYYYYMLSLCLLLPNFILKNCIMLNYFCTQTKSLIFALWQIVAHTKNNLWLK